MEKQYGSLIIYVNHSANHNKFYTMIEQTDGRHFDANYGVDSKDTWFKTKEYDMYKWSECSQKRIQHGYTIEREARVNVGLYEICKKKLKQLSEKNHTQTVSNLWNSLLRNGCLSVDEMKIANDLFR